MTDLRAYNSPHLQQHKLLPPLRPTYSLLSEPCWQASRLSHPQLALSSLPAVLRHLTPSSWQTLISSHQRLQLESDLAGLDCLCLPRFLQPTLCCNTHGMRQHTHTFTGARLYSHDSLQHPAVHV
eukprot:768109-Hanusia_phi.AAC.7